MGRYRLIQDGQPAAWAEGPGALFEIHHYAFVYGQDSPVQIEQHSGGRWKAFANHSDLTEWQKA